MFKKISFYLILITISIFICLLTLEILLRVAGASFLWFQHRNNWTNKDKNAYTILCLGESTTALGGDDSYPAQLQRILNARSSQLTFKVINKGIPGQGTDYILEHLPGWLIEYNPAVVVVMMGINDHNERIPIDDKLRQNKNPLSFVSHLRVYSLFRWLQLQIKSDGLREKTVQSPQVSPPVEDQQVIEEVKRIVLVEAAFRENQFVKAEEILLHLKSSKNPQIEKYAKQKLYDFYFHMEYAPQLMSLIDEDLKTPQNPRVVNMAMQLCQERKYVDQLIPLIVGHTSRAKDKWPYYNLLEGCFSYLGLTQQAMFFSDLAHKEEISKINPHTQYNYRRLIDLLHQRNIVPVVMQYPLRDIKSLKIMLEGHVGTQKIFWVENNTNFQEALRTNTYESLFTDRFAGNFGHCTAQGNQLIAQALSETILKEILKGL